ncbi:hypothetical protein [Streptomyces adustus]|uniref:hypothetical protein n=1 Tax=Streptomyces adustus TaxID=1609272 RepID=UPI00371416D4
MIPVPPLPEIRLPAQWHTHAVRGGRHAQELRMTGVTGGAGVRLERCAAGRLRDAYPVGRHDIEVQADDCPTGLLGELLTALTEVVGDADPRCRRLVVATAVGDGPRIAAAQSAGFRHVVDVDLGSAELGLLTWEPAWATPIDPDLDRVPGA